MKEWQTLIAGLSLALSIAYAGTAVFRLSFNAGRAVQQHEQMITMLQIQQSQIDRLLSDCKK